MIEDFQGTRVTVMGLGRFGGGVGVTRWLASQGARVLVTDLAGPDALASSLEAIADCNVALRLGEHRDTDFRETDLVVVNPAVPERAPQLAVAREAGVPVTTEINLFVERCRGTCIGVTGSVGKSTVTAMIGHVLERTLPQRRTWVGGNLGRSLLDALPSIAPSDFVVLELSSFQLERTAAIRWSPPLAVLTNLTPNHLDWHGDFERYAAAKFNIARYQDPQRDALVVGPDAALLERVLRSLPQAAGVRQYRLTDDVPECWVVDRHGALGERPSAFWPELRLAVPGRHNRENAAAALSIATLLGVRPADGAAALRDFAGLPHRLQKVATRDGVTYYNDSKSSTPAAAITAMQAIDAPLLVILGGYDKHIDLSSVACLAAERAKFVACIGATGPWLARHMQERGGQALLCASLPEAVAACRARAVAGDAVLLSPACASWDMFSDYRQRGDAFVALVEHDRPPGTLP